MKDTIIKGFSIGSIIFVAIVILMVLTFTSAVSNVITVGMMMSAENSIATANWTNRILTIEKIVIQIVDKFFDAQ